MQKITKLTPEQLDQKVLYFAYGSNMYQPRLEARVGKVECIGTYVLPDYKLTFDTGNQIESFANVKQVKGETCEGVVYEMTYGQLRHLDWFEGLYERVKEDYNGRRLHVYISNDWRDERRTPAITPSYRSALVMGCVTHKLYKTMAIVDKILGVSARFYQYIERWD